MKVLFFVLILMFTINIFPQNVLFNKAQCIENNLLIKKKLSKDNSLYLAIERNLTGTGFITDWMNKMKDYKVKQASSVITFEIQKNQLILSMESIYFYSEYYNFSSKIKLNDDLKYQNEFNDKLRMAFFSSAISELKSADFSKYSCGELYLNLLDDACLPVLNEIPTFKSNCKIMEIK